jgi:hypothetical protein
MKIKALTAFWHRLLGIERVRVGTNTREGRPSLRHQPALPRLPDAIVSRSGSNELGKRIGRASRPEFSKLAAQNSRQF